MILKKSLLAISISSLMLNGCNSKRPDQQAQIPATKVYIPLPGPDHWQSGWSKDSTVTVHLIADPDNLHPSNGTSQVRAELNLYLQMSLLQTDLRTSELRPGLCKALPEISSDQLRLTFELRDEPRWDDGTMITAADVIFTTKAAKCPLTNNPAAKPYFDNVSDIIPDTSNPRRFTVVMKQPYFQNTGIWSDYPIIQRSFYDASDILHRYTFKQFNDSAFDAASHPDLIAWSTHYNESANGDNPSGLSGAGPYKLEKWEQGQYIILEKKKNHWTDHSDKYWERSYPAKIVFRINRDATTQQLAFKNQEFDATSSISARTLTELQKDSTFNHNYHSAFVHTYGYTYIALNTKPSIKQNPSLSDITVRRALAFAVPVRDIITIINKGVNKPVSGPVSFLKKSCDSTLAFIEFDPVQTARQLENAGWNKSGPDGIRQKMMNGKVVKLEFELAYLATQSEWKDMAIMIQEGMAKAGVKINPVAYDFPVWMQKASAHEFDMLMGAWNNTAMPDDYAQLWSTESWKSNGPNFTGFGNDESDALIKKMNALPQNDQRIALEKQLQQIIYKEQPYIFMYGLVRRSVMHKRYDGAAFYAERPGMLYNTLSVAAAHLSASVTQ